MYILYQDFRKNNIYVEGWKINILGDKITGMNDFDSWNEIKKKIDGENDKPNRFPKEGEVWMSSLGRKILCFGRFRYLLNKRN